MPAMPKSTAEATAAFLTLLPKDPALTTRPMFGNMAAFVNGNMFAGLFGDALFVRLPEDAREAEKAGGKRLRADARKGDDRLRLCRRHLAGEACPGTRGDRTGAGVDEQDAR